MTRTHIYIAIAAVILAGILIGSLWSNYRISSLERDAAHAGADAARNEQLARELETEAAGYRAKIQYLERQIAAIRDIAAKQDEELKTFMDNSSRARRDVERARRTRTTAVTNEELCTRLAELGYPCSR